MCGICGITDFDGVPVEENLIRKMCRVLSHRGPDGEGIFVSRAGTENGLEIGVGLGHRRLSVIDLSDAGRQPMSNRDGSLWIAYNGEIYNFPELRRGLEKKGYVFKSDTDTETLLYLFEEYGEACIGRLNGMFAFAIWDKINGRLFLCRDRAGIKPLVYYWDGKRFVFASEIKAILCDPSVPREIDEHALHLYLTFNYIPAPHTIFKGIRKLPPGHCLVLENGVPAMKQYWDAPLAADPDFDWHQLEAIKERLYETVRSAVEMRMISDVPLGAFLSGGIDSGIVVALMAKYSREPVKTFSIGFKDASLFDETRHARETAAMYKTDHHEFRLAPRDMFDVLPDVLSCFDEPFADSSAIPTFVVSRETRKHVTVALSGDGGDELFAGYRSYLGEYYRAAYLAVPALFRKSVFENLASRLPDSRDTKIMEHIRRVKKFIRSAKGSFPERAMALKTIFPEDLRARILKGPWKENMAGDSRGVDIVGNLLERYQGDRTNRILYSDFKCSLPGDMLTKVDWMSMKNSLEVRVPLLDYRVANLAFGIPGKMKIRRGNTKHILKETFKSILPAGICRRPKAGFEVPISKWLKTDLNFLISNYLGKEKIASQEMFDYGTVQSLISDFMNNRTDNSWLLWNLIVFQYWREMYLEG